MSLPSVALMTVFATASESFAKSKLANLLRAVT